ncbi:MAG TPA: extracellular solute-binding protein, partial [Chloroflexota bacterium]|nr:extracellular solute-binding protein [Chloroflexota bacterium]
MKSPSTITRRRVLQGAALGAAALALPRSASAARPSGVVTLEFWNPAVDPVGKKVIAKLADQFNGTVGKAKGILVQNRPIADDNNAAKYTTAMTSSGSPDVVMTYSYDYLAPWAANGFIRPVDSYFSTTGMAENDLLPVVKDSVQLAGHTWGLLQEFDFAQLFWNKRLHTGALPTTLDELDALAKRYTVFDKHGNLTQAGLIPWSNKTFDPYTTGVALFGGSFYNQSTGKWTI